MNPLHRRLLGIGVLAFVASHCGGSTIPDSTVLEGRAPGDGGPVDDSGLCEGTASPDGAPAVPQEHRAAAVACGRSSPSGRTASSGAPASSAPYTGSACSSDRECTGNGSDPTPYCRGNQCGIDECLVDADCASGTVCVCGSDAGWGTLFLRNVCVAASCRIDADCGPNGYCSPSRGYCGSVNGFNCHTPQDTCIDPAKDCGCGGNACVYAPTVGHFVCGSSVCMG
jgi:hypothetical protein